ncbi:MAG TPA: YbjQ family protein [Verrucomicrobiota bacterium]|nr:YbjQ family protein [Verrucomicrobiota bacterium]
MAEVHSMTTTAFELAGYKTTKTLGVVRGIVVRSRSVVGNLVASIQIFFGGKISTYTTLCEQAREEAFLQMLAHAGELGANGVIGVRYDATEIAPGVTEVLCYGTAVFVELSLNKI